MSTICRGVVLAAGKENSEHDDRKRRIRKGPKRDIAAPFQPSPDASTPKICPLTYRDRPSNRVDYMSCHFQELDTGNDIAFEKYVGPTPESNWVIPGKLLVGAYPASQDDAETFELLTSILRLGVTQFVCLQLEYKADGITEAMWRRGQALRPYYEDVKLLIRNKHMFKVLSQESTVCESDQLSFVHLPIKDCSVTDDGGVFQLALTLVENLHRGEVQYIHCWGGHGRTGTVVCVMLHLMYGLSAQEAMDYCQTVHDLRQCPVAVGSPQTQSQRDQVSRIIRIAEVQEKRYQESLSFQNRGNGATSKQQPPRSRFTFEEVDEDDNCHNAGPAAGCSGTESAAAGAAAGNDVSSSRTKQRSTSTENCGSIIPSHPVKKSSGHSSDDDDTPANSPGADQQPQKYQAVEPTCLIKSGKKSILGLHESEPIPSGESTDFPTIFVPTATAVTTAAPSTAAVAEPADAEDKVTPVNETCVQSDPHLDPTDKSGNEKREKPTINASSSVGLTRGDKETSTSPVPSSWFWSSTSISTTPTSQSHAHPKPPKDNTHGSSLSWKGSLKGLRKWSSAKFKSPPSTPTAAPSACNSSESDATRILGSISADCGHGNGAEETRKGEHSTVTTRARDVDRSMSGRRKSNGRKWTLPNPLKMATGPSPTSSTAPATTASTIAATTSR